MGDLVPIDGGGAVSKPTDGQSLFAAVVDQMTARGWYWPRSEIAIAVRHGATALQDGAPAEWVLLGCVVALRRGQPQLAARIILDVCNKQTGAYVSREDYWQALDERSIEELEVERRAREERLRAHRERQLEEGEG